MDGNAVTDASAKTNVDIVLEGGGVKGIALVGALRELCAAHTVQRVAGTSAGAIVAALLAAGYTIPELEREMRSLDFASFEDRPARHFRKVGATLAVLLHNGVFKGDALHTWIEERLADKNVTTFQQLRRQEAGDDTGTSPYKLAVVVSDISRGRELHLPEDYRALCGVDPDTAKVADAVRASASIPFYFRPVRFRTGPSLESQRLVFVDGGLLSNFPVGLFDRRGATPPRWPTIGIKLSMRRTPSQQWQPARNPVELARRLVSTMTSAHDRIHVDQSSVQDRTIFVDTDKVRSTDFRISQEQVEMLYANGRSAAQQFLATWDFQQWLNRYHLSRGVPGTPP
ncbi:patatin-like phospholipase family protein [Streptomyces sp. IB201691-2A2]|uniref:patatin-like phospholipase family protein n=1 Tax=Streptomyces sp. IB201691-2A2 TaxID=2561920 RepID=UPI00163DBD55|nr:patatin-like phospholipase family protein [Streptomyces sp. IB201691-2A2]